MLPLVGGRGEGEQGLLTAEKHSLVTTKKKAHLISHGVK